MEGIWLVAFIALWVLVALIAIAIIGIYRSLGILFNTLSSQGSNGLHDPSLMNPPPSNLQPGQLLPNLIAKTVSDKDEDLTLQINCTTAITVISPSCAPCHHLVSEIVNGSRKLDPTGGAVQQWMIVSLSAISQLNKIAGGIELPNDAKIFFSTGENVDKAWGITSTPVTIILDKNRKVVRQIFGG